MSVRRRRTGLVNRWSRTLSVLAPWRRGLTQDSVLDSEVVLTKMKLFSASHRNLLTSADSSSSVSSASEPQTLDQNQPESSEQVQENRVQDCGYLAAILSPLSGRYKPEESEDSGVELLPSGANSPRSPLGSEKSFTVHSRGSSCDSGDSSPEMHGRGLKTEGSLTADQDQDQDQGRSVGASEESEDGSRIRSRDGVEDMAECCSETQSLSSGLGYLQHLCRLMERISGLQDLVLRLQRQLRSERQDRTLDRDRLDVLMQSCTCGAADLVFTEVPQSPTRPESLSQTSLNQDLRTIPESTLRVYSSRAECDSAPWRRRRRSCTEDDCHIWSRDAHLHRRLSDRSSSSWGRVRDLVKRTRLRSQSRLSPGSFKTSCPQLYRPDLGPTEVQVQTRRSMMVLGQSLDWPWLR